MSAAVLHWTLALSLALLWCSAAWHKFRDPAGFARAIDAYELLPAPVARLASRFLPWVEALICVALLIPATRAAAGGAGAALLLLYGGAMAINLARGRDDIDCGCGSGPAQRISLWLVARNTVLCAVSLLLLSPVEDPPTAMTGLLPALPAAALLCIAYTAVSSILQERAAADRDTD